MLEHGTKEAEITGYCVIWMGNVDTDLTTISCEGGKPWPLKAANVRIHEDGGSSFALPVKNIKGVKLPASTRWWSGRSRGESYEEPKSPYPEGAA